MIESTLKAIHHISRPGQPPANGDTVEIETVGGMVMAVDPATRKATITPKRFVITSDDAGGLTIKP